MVKIQPVYTLMVLQEKCKGTGRSGPFFDPIWIQLVCILTVLQVKRNGLKVTIFINSVFFRV